MDLEQKINWNDEVVLRRLIKNEIKISSVKGIVEKNENKVGFGKNLLLRPLFALFFLFFESALFFLFMFGGLFFLRPFFALIFLL